METRLQKTFALGLLAGELAGATNRLSPFPGFPFGRLLVSLTKLHFAENAFALQLLLEGAKRLIDIVVANIDLHVVVTAFLS